MRVDFLVYYLGDREYEYVPVGHELALPISIGTADAEPDTAQRLYPAISARFAEHVESYYRQGELLLRSERGELAAMRLALVSGKAHKYHPLLVADYRARKGVVGRVDDMARAYHCSRTTIWRELRAAAASGEIAEDELQVRRSL